MCTVFCSRGKRGRDLFRRIYAADPFTNFTAAVTDLYTPLRLVSNLALVAPARIGSTRYRIRRILVLSKYFVYFYGILHFPGCCQRVLLFRRTSRRLLLHKLQAVEVVALSSPSPYVLLVQHIPVVYFEKEEFPEIEAFMREVSDTYGFEFLRYAMSYKDGMQDLVDSRGIEVRRVCVSCTRKSFSNLLRASVYPNLTLCTSNEDPPDENCTMILPRRTKLPL